MGKRTRGLTTSRRRALRRSLCLDANSSSRRPVRHHDLQGFLVLRQQQPECAMGFQEAARSPDDNISTVGVENAALLRKAVERVTGDRQDFAPTRVYDLDRFGCQSQVGECFQQSWTGSELFWQTVGAA